MAPEVQVASPHISSSLRTFRGHALVPCRALLMRTLPKLRMLATSAVCVSHSDDVLCED